MCNQCNGTGILQMPLACSVACSNGTGMCMGHSTLCMAEALETLRLPTPCRLQYVLEDSLSKIRIGVCAMDKKATSKPMKEIITRITSFNEFEVIIFGDQVCPRGGAPGRLKAL